LCRLGVNVDHVATLRQNRKTSYPDPVAAAIAAEAAGAHQITIHLREDRRHIQDRDLLVLRHTVQTRLNLEMAATAEMVRIACAVQPDQVTLVPERRQELTTEGGLNVAGQKKKLSSTVKKLQSAGISVSMFIDPVEKQIDASADTGADGIELHTGEYANHTDQDLLEKEFTRLEISAGMGVASGLKVYAGHGLHYKNTRPLAELSEIEELNIGHSIVSRAFFVGMEVAVKEMLELIIVGRAK
jgi:pyridoxine 5-phosphate synthase